MKKMEETLEVSFTADRLSISPSGDVALLSHPGEAGTKLRGSWRSSALTCHEMKNPSEPVPM